MASLDAGAADVPPPKKRLKTASAAAGVSVPVDAAMEKLIRLRDSARLSRDWETADRLREELRACGWKPQDKSSSTDAAEPGGQTVVLRTGKLLHKTGQAKRKVLKTIEVRTTGLFSKAKKGTAFHLLQAKGNGTTAFTKEEGGFAVRDSTFFFIGDEKSDEAAQSAWLAALKNCGFVA
jgi:hypothetical protein|tara:strand:- start:273 stop:809 length:537 start_codon:yes stop_codon:yes gene_type:complete